MLRFCKELLARCGSEQVFARCTRNLGRMEGSRTMMESVFGTVRNQRQSTGSTKLGAHGRSPFKDGSYSRAIKSRIRRLLPDWAVLIYLYRKGHGVFPKLARPVTFNEKLLHRNLFDRRLLLTEMADKAVARLYVEARLGPQILPKLYYITTLP